MDYEEITVDHGYDVADLSDALVENFNFSEPDNPTGTKSDMLHYEGPDGQENGYAVVTEDDVTLVPYDQDVDDAWEEKAEDAIKYLMEHEDAAIDLDELYDGEPSPDPDLGGYSEDIDVTLDRDSLNSQHSHYL